MAGKKSKQSVLKRKTGPDKNRTGLKPQESFHAGNIYKKYTRSSIVIFFVIFLLFCFSVFKNIRYPLFWADESITVVGGQRVLQFGYPKVHDGKNIFYDLRHSNLKLGIDEKTDAYVGGTGWVHYYLAAIGVKLAESFSDMYAKTGIIRSVFALVGILGMLLFILFLSRFFEDRFSKFLFAGLFFFMALFSISLTLIVREVRYYSPTILLFCFITGYYAVARFKKISNYYLFAITVSIALFLLFHTFPPAYFIVIASLGLSEMIIIVFGLLQKNKLKAILISSLPFSIPIVISMLGVLALLPYFRTFEIAKAMAEYNKYTTALYWWNIKNVFSYFWNFELFWLAIVLKVFILVKSPKLFRSGDPKFKVSLFFSLLFLVYCFAICRIPNFAFTRYFIPALLVLFAIIIFDLFCLNTFFPVKSIKGLQIKTTLFMIFGLIILISVMVQNAKEISGHITELSEPYKGPLDYTIPYIKEKYKRTDTLVIATNYEESSYMYYLDSKVIIGYIGNNLQEDLKLKPHIISYRKIWRNLPQAFNFFRSKFPSTYKYFPVYDNAVNNIPELNYISDFNHLFETKPNTSEKDAADLYIIE